MPSVIFTPAARTEMVEAHAWYDAHGQGLGEQFLAEIDKAVDRMATAPQHFPKVFLDIRRIRVNRFPYGLFFRLDDDIAYVLACFHASRNPRQWQRRL